MRSKTTDKELTALIATTATTLQSLHGIGPSGTARLLVEVGDITRFPDESTLRVVERHRTDRRLIR